MSDIVNSENTGYFLELALKVAGFFLSFVGGIVAATWAVAAKVKGFDDRLRSVESLQSNCQVNTLGKIDQKLDRIHERIDEILLSKAGKQKETE